MTAWDLGRCTARQISFFTTSLALACAIAPAIAQAQAGISTSGPTGPADAPTPATAPANSVSGIGDINLYPKRVVIDEHARVASIGLYNKVPVTGDYDIAITDMMMTNDGRLVDLASVSDPVARANVKAASQMLRWSPHRVTLPGSESQMVRVMAHVPPDLPPGEYRAHFSVVAVPPGEDGLSIQQAAGDTDPKGGIGVKITPRFGISIPIIVRVGATTLNAGFKDMAIVKLPDGARGLRFKITRDGTRSAFGDIAVTAPGLKKPLAAMKGIGVYTELSEREVSLGFDPKLAVSYAPGTRLTVTYTDDDANPGKVLAHQDIVVP